MLSAALTFLLAVPARAQTGADEMSPDDVARTEEARAAFERGVAAYEAGSFEEALVSFQRAYELTASPDILYNIGTVADRLRRDELALSSYEGYLAGRPDAEDRVNIEARIAAIRGALAAAEAARAAEGTGASGAGTSGAGASGTGDAGAGDETRDAAGASDTPGAAGGSGEPPASDPGAGPWVLVATGGVAVAGGVVLLVLTAVDLDAASRATTWSALSGPHDRVPILSGIGWPLLGVGVALLGGGIGWALAGSPGSSARGRSEATARVRVTGAGLWLEGTF